MSFENIKLEKGMYAVFNKSFTEILEGLDPSEDYRGTEFEGLDAYQRQLRRFGIRVSGPGCDIVEKFFENSESAVLFPEFVSRAVKSGMNLNNVIPSIVSTKIITNTLDCRVLTTNVELASTNPVSEGSTMQEVTIRTNDTLLKLKKYGHNITSSYEALRLQNLEIVSMILRRLGSLFINHQLKEMTNAIGDYDGLDSQVLSYDNLLSLWAYLKPYRMNVMMASYNTAKDILSLSEFRDANAGLTFHGTGKDLTPLGAKLVCNNYLADKLVIGFDKDFAFQMYQMGDLIVDYNKLIEKQLNSAAVSLTFGFSKILPKSLKGLDYSGN